MKPFEEPLYSQSFIDAGKGQPIILLHGMFGNMAMWHSTIDFLCTQYRVVVPRIPLYNTPFHHANLKNLREILHDFLDWHQLTDVTLVGTDMGGQLALEYAYHHTDRVRKVIISGSSGIFENLPRLDNKKEYNSVPLQVNEVFSNETFSTKDTVGSSIADKAYHIGNMFSKSLHSSAFAKTSKQNELTNFLSKLTVPVLIVWGLQDKITPPEVALHLHDLLRFSTLKFIDECGHLPMIEKSEAYTKAVIDFLNP